MRALQAGQPPVGDGEQPPWVCTLGVPPQGTGRHPAPVLAAGAVETRPALLQRETTRLAQRRDELGSRAEAVFRRLLFWQNCSLDNYSVSPKLSPAVPAAAGALLVSCPLLPCPVGPVLGSCCGPSWRELPSIHL